VWDPDNVGGWYTFVGNGPIGGRDALGLDGEPGETDEERPFSDPSGDASNAVPEPGETAAAIAALHAAQLFIWDELLNDDGAGPQDDGPQDQGESNSPTRDETDPSRAASGDSDEETGATRPKTSSAPGWTRTWTVPAELKMTEQVLKHDAPELRKALIYLTGLILEEPGWKTD
jgi:hypothetical protein